MFCDVYILELSRFETLALETITFSDAMLSDINACVMLRFLAVPFLPAFPRIEEEGVGVGTLWS
jgi:hypothetical protein